MEWSNDIEAIIKHVPEQPISVAMVRQIVSVLDYTRLEPTDSESEIASFCQKAENVYGKVAAVCVLPSFIQMAKHVLDAKGIPVATVANFPLGTEPLDQVLSDIKQALQIGAEEIDVVFPYQRYLNGEHQYARQFVEACKIAADNKKLKVIIETGAFHDLAVIAEVANDALIAGADFIKTSTGKGLPGATVEAVATMALIVKKLQPELQRPLGLKVSGGVKEIKQAAHYMSLVQHILGEQYLTARTFRIGASHLMDQLLHFNTSISA